MQIENKIREIISEQLDANVDEIKKETSFIDDLGADSLAIVELVLALEEAFEIDIPDEASNSIKTFKDAVDYISEQKGR